MNGNEDLFYEGFEVLDRVDGRGGARPGAGRKAGAYEKPERIIDFEKAKARKEAALADMHELQFRIKSGEYVSRDSVRQASTTIMSAVAQTLRSVGDNLERQGVAPDVCAKVDAILADTLADAARDLRMLTDD
ncbi:MAG: hypothetical protein RIS35_3761 [Pseudomonadota bacterium]|jgi:phage terminase Nu1 subunit (DNA packaging protein)